MNIKDYGFKENLIRNNMEGKIPARIIATHKERYEIVCDKGSGFAKIKRGCFYETSQLPELAKIISLRQMGLSINNIKSILHGSDLEQILKLRKQELETEISLSNSQLLQINNLLEGKNMEREVIVKELPSYTIYYKEGVIKNFSEIVKFILQWL